MNDHKQRWEIVMEAYLTPYEERTEAQQTITKFGLCDAIEPNILGEYTDLIRVMLSMNPGGGIFWYPVRNQGTHGTLYGKFEEEYDSFRATMAGLFCAMSTTDYERFLDCPTSAGGR